MFLVIEENKAEVAISISTGRGSFVMIDMFTTELIVILVRLVLDRFRAQIRQNTKNAIGFRMILE